MKAKWILLLTLLFWASPSFAQNKDKDGTITANDTCVTLQKSINDPGVSIQLSGTFSATVDFKGTAAAAVLTTTLWKSLEGVPSGGGAGVTSATTANIWKFDGSGLSGVQACTGAMGFTSGTVTVRIVSSSGARSVKNTVGTGDLSGSGFTSGRVPVANGASSLVDDSDLTFSGDTLTATKIIGSTSITDSGLTATRVPFASTGGLLADDGDLTFTGGNTLNTQNLVINGTCTGCGGGAPALTSTYLAIGDVSNLLSSISGAYLNGTLYNTALGITALDSITTGNYNVGVGQNALTGATSTANNTAIGYNAGAGLVASPGYNTAVGSLALDSVDAGSHSNTAIGYSALRTTSGNYSVAVGRAACSGCLSGGANTAIGAFAMDQAVTGNGNIAIGGAATVPNAAADDQLAIGGNGAAYFIRGNLSNLTVTPALTMTSLTGTGTRAVMADSSGVLSAVAPVFKTATVTLNNAQIKSLPTDSPITLVTGVSGKVISPQSVTTVFNWAADYTNVEGGVTQALLGWLNKGPLFAVLKNALLSSGGNAVALRSGGPFVQGELASEYAGDALLFVTNLFTGVVDTLTPSGIAIGATVTDIPVADALSNTGSGINAIFHVVNTAGSYVVTVPTAKGSGFNAGDVIVFDGADLGGVTGIGVISALTPAGTSVGAGTYDIASADALSNTGVGTGATFHVVNAAGAYVVTVPVDAGSDFAAGDILVLDGGTLGGVTGVNDLTITIDTVVGNNLTVTINAVVSETRDFTGGNAANSLTITTTYQEVAVP
jgi:hypothetical protein